MKKYNYGELYINNVLYEVKEVQKHDENLIINYRLCEGVFYGTKKLIYLNGDACLTEKKRTLAHELTHAFLFETQLNHKDLYTEEEVCRFIELYSFIILELVKEFYNIKKKTS